MTYSNKISMEDFLISGKAVVEKALMSYCCDKPDGAPRRLWDAMSYSLLAGGKRVRPILCLETAEMFGADQEISMPFAVAVEMIHTASLIHDDLPCMDNDSLRRGKPTNHVKFGEPLALMAGTSLFIAAFEHAIANGRYAGQAKTVKAVGILMKAAGPAGIHGGQTLDTDKKSQRKERNFVFDIALYKTACLIQASAMCGAVIGGATDEELSIVKTYSRHLGLAFQIADDILDITADTSSLGKTPGKDIEQGKITFPSSFGYERSVKLVEEQSQLAVEEALKLGPKGLFFADLAVYLASRSK